MRNYFTLSVDQVLNENAESSLLSFNFVLPADPAMITEHQKDGIVQLFQLLHPYVNNEHHQEIDVPCLTSKEFKEFAMEDYRLLTRCLHALGTGEFEFDKEMCDNVSWQSRRYSCVCASEMLARCHQNKSGRFHRFFTDQLSSTPVTKNFKQICSFLRLSESHESIRRANAEKAISSILKGEDYPARGLVIFGMDNFGLKEKIGYDQWTIMQLIKVSEEQLKRVGFYAKNPNQRINRKGRSIEKIIEENSAVGVDTASQVVGIKAQDYCVLTKYVLTHIETSLKLMLPSQKECEEMAKSCNFLWPHSKIPKNLGLRLPENPSQILQTTDKVFAVPRMYAPRDDDEFEDHLEDINGNDFDIDDEEAVDGNSGIVDIEDQQLPESLSEESESEKSETSFQDLCKEQAAHQASSDDWPVAGDSYQSLYERNNMVLDIPLHDDLAKADVVKSLMDYALRVTRPGSILNALEFEQEDPVQTIMVPLTGDGSPVESSHRIKDADKTSGENKYDAIRFFPGGFHLALELHRIRGKFFEDTFGFFVSRWRSTLGRQKWIMEPQDPNDLLEEIYEYILAHYRCAADCLAEQLSCNELSPVQVNNHMMQRAATCPFAMAVLLELRFAEVTIIMRDSEKSGPRGDVDLFLTGMRFSLILFTVTHAVKYVRICTEFLHWWATSSDAEKILFKNFIYTKLTAHGRPIWADRCVEKTMMHLRMFLGKHKGQGQDVKVLHSALGMQDHLEKRRGAKELHEHDETRSNDVSWNDHERPISHVFVQTYLACKKINLYGEGPMHFKKTTANSDQSEENTESDQLLQTPAGEKLNEEMLKCISIGKSRGPAYYQKFYIDSQNQVSRSEEDMGLTGIQTTAQKLKDGFDKKIAQATSINADELSKVCTKKILIEEMNKVPDSPGTYPRPFNLLAAKKMDLAKALCLKRGRYFRMCPEAKQEIINRITMQERGGASSNAERQQELLDLFYQLDPDVAAAFEETRSILRALN